MIKGKQTRKQAVSIVEMAGVHQQHICQAATLASSNTFAKYYRLNLMTKAWLDFGRKVLRVAGFSSVIAGTIRSPRRVDTHIDLSTSSATLYAIAALPASGHVYSVITKQLNTTGIDSLRSVLFAFMGETLCRVALSTVFSLYLVICNQMCLLHSLSSQWAIQPSGYGKDWTMIGYGTEG